jgi:hypothetical protein
VKTAGFSLLLAFLKAFAVGELLILLRQNK